MRIRKDMIAKAKALKEEAERAKRLELEAMLVERKEQIYDEEEKWKVEDSQSDERVQGGNAQDSEWKEGNESKSGYSNSNERSENDKEEEAKKS